VFLRLILVAAVAAAAPLRAQIGQPEYAQRRAALVSRMEDGVLLARGAEEPVEDYLSFWQTSSFIYLSGYQEPNAALVMVKRGGQAQWTLFVQPRNPAQEVWSGKLHGLDGATKETGLPTRSIADLRAVLDSLLSGTTKLYVIGDYQARREGPASADDQFVQALTRGKNGVTVASGDGLVRQLRGHKSPAELDLIQKSVAITVEAQKEAFQAVAPGVNEYEIQALIEYTFRRRGADRPSFSTIVGSGPNSTTLHYNADDRLMERGDVVVMDIGASYHGYSADVTRTLPVSGTFTPEQRAIYQLVRDAQAAGERQAKLGAQPRLLSDSANAVLSAGLAKLGLIESPNATYDCEGGGGQCRQLSLYYMHGLGHGIGLDVHDPDQWGSGIAPGSAFTIEPGIYVRGNLLEILPKTSRNAAMIEKLRAAVEKYANIGVRIEDDYIATEKGVEWISRAPREADEIEAMMKKKS
jgi:Xaa-Pro aminopeptidase